MRIAIAVLAALLLLTVAARACPAPTPADAGKVCIVNSSGTGYVLLPKLRWDFLADGLSNGGAYGFMCSKNNANCLAQVDQNGLTRNLMYLGNDSTIMLGPSNDDGFFSIISHPPFNADWNRTEYDFRGANIPEGLTVEPIGNGYTSAPGGNSNFLFTTKAIAPGDGLRISATNRRTQIGYRTQLYFTLNVLDDIGVDLQFGVQTADQVRRVYMRFSSDALHHVTTATCTITNGSASSTKSFAFAMLQERRKFLIFFPNGTASPIWLMAANDNNEFDHALGCSFAQNDAAMPNTSDLLIPFVQMRTYDQPLSRTLVTGKIDFGNEW